MSTAARYTPRYGHKNKTPARKAVLQPDRVLLLVGTALVIAFLGYSLYSTIGGLSDAASVANIFSALAMVGVVVMLGAVMLRRWRRASNAATLGGFALLASFVGYALYNATDAFVQHHAVGSAFAVAGMCGLMFLLAAGAIQRIRT